MEKSLDKYYRLLLDDYSAAAFTTFDKEYYGTIDDVRGLIDALKFDKKRRDSHKDTIEAFERYVSGEKKSIHNVAYRDVPILTPIKVLLQAEQNVENMEWEHLNTWQWVCEMKLSSAKIQHYWIKDGKQYRRIMKAQVVGLCYKDTVGKWTDPKTMFWGFPGMLVRDGDILYNRLACIEKNFKTLEELQVDYENYLNEPNVDFEKFCDDIFGDG